MELSEDICHPKNQENVSKFPKNLNNGDTVMTSSTTSMTSSLSSPVDSGVQLLDSESEATSVMSVSGTGCEIEQILNLDGETSSKDIKYDSKRHTVINLTEGMEDINLYSQSDVKAPCIIENNDNTDDDTETNELKCQMDLFEKEFGIAGLKEYFLCNTTFSCKDPSDFDNLNINGGTSNKPNIDAKYNSISVSNSSPCLRNDILSDYRGHGILNKSFSDDVFEMEHPIQGKLNPTTTEADLMNVSLTSYELLDYTSQNIEVPIENDQMNVSMSEEVNENLCSQLKNNFETIEENIPQEVPVIEPEPKLVEEQIVYRRQRKKKSKSDTPKKRVSFHEDILNSTKIDDIHINHGFITHEEDVSLSFFQRGFVRKPDVVKGRYSWAAEGDAPYYEKQISERKTNSAIYMQNPRYSSTSSSSTGSISSSIDEEDSSDENMPRKNPSLTQPKTSCLKKTPNKKTIDTKIVHEEINIPRQKSDSNLLDTNIFGSLKNILTFSTSVPLAERGVPEGQEDIPVYSSSEEKTNRRRSCTNFSFVNTEGMILEEPVKRRGNLNLEVAKSNFRLSRSEGFYPNYPVEQQLPPNVILCDSNVYEHKGISYSYEYDNFQKTFEQQNKAKSSTLYQLIMKEFNFFRKKSKEEPEKEANEVFSCGTSSPEKNESTSEEFVSKTNDKSSKSLLSSCASSKLDWSDNDATISEYSEVSNSRHLNSPKRKVNKSNHYSVQAFKISSEANSDPFLSKSETISRPSTSKSSLIDRFLKNVTLKKILDAKSAKRHKENKRCLSLYVKGVKGEFSGYDDVDKELEKEILVGLEQKDKNSIVYDKKMIAQFKREVFRSQLETLKRFFMVRSTYTTSGDSKPLLAILTNATIYITSLGSNGRYRNHFLLPYTELNTVLIGPSAQTIHLSNMKQDMQCMITTGCAMVTNDFIGQLEMAMRKDINRPRMLAVKQLSMQDMVNLRRAICKQTAVHKDEDYVYYSIVDVQELGTDIGDGAPMGPSKEGPLMFRTQELNSKWETAYFILKAGVMYMLSSASHRIPMKVYPLINGACHGARRIPTSPRPHTFQIIVDGKSLQLAAPDEYVASEWLQALIHAANGSYCKEKMVTQSCSLLMTTDHILTVREAFPCTVRSLLPDNNSHDPIKGPQALSCAAILDLVSFRLPSAEQSWCILEFACREVYECGGDWILYFSSNAELENFISTLEVLWDYNNEKNESFPLSTIPETDPLSQKCVDVYMSLKNSWSSNTVHLQFL
ncbi:hypothetical protein HHI36_006649 [Cryptolaemus montrouzieri]|uniref:PH domain-containing protein n=1 Tax=Cryptolaemus montrouzieri TaxID=559131 RepID=A0ABD2NY11_9CUCU